MCVFLPSGTFLEKKRDVGKGSQSTFLDLAVCGKGRYDKDLVRTER